MLNKLSEAAGYKVLSYHQGHFIDSVTVSFACIGEVDSKGIKNVQITFVSLGSDSSFRNIFACKPFEANPGQLEIFTTKLENSSYDCLYFDSGDYYVGTGGGEVYQFIADARQRIVYRTHFVFSKEQRPGVYFYAECKTEEIRKLFLNHLRNDYPEVTILRTDPVF
ncbi:MAG: hypothetical protein LWX56_03040 [Ignavibacteria bacterium]|nr:hypothetical protein [Ignavibacteria bacterium]